MNEFRARAGAFLRTRLRSDVRRARCHALDSLLNGGDIDPKLIEPLDRQRNRARTLNREDLAVGIGQDPNASRKLFEAVIGADDTLPRFFLDQGQAAASAVGRLKVRHGDGSALYGTGSLVSQQLLITNNHVIQSADDAANSVLELGYFEVAPDTFPPSHQLFQVDPGRFFYTNEALDFTLVGVEPQNGQASTADYGALELFAQSGKALLGERVNIVQHAGGRPQTVSIRENQVVDVFDAWVHYAADTEPGSSGAPVFNDEWQLVAIHHASVPSDAQEGGVVNEGIRISAIVEDLQQALG